jgi:glycosyltransferase involved in cell wall biosynthesis
MAKEWIKKGHRVRMAGASFSHVRAKQPLFNGEKIRKRTIENIDGIEYVWYPTPSYSGNGVGRVINILVFLAQLFFDAKRTIKEFKPDVVIASSTYPMDNWVAHYIAKKASAKHIYEIHDLWPLSPIELGGMSPSHPFIRLCQKAENDAYRDADAVVSILPNVQEHVVEHGLDLRKLFIVPNGVVVEEWQGDKQRPLENKAIADYVAMVKGKGKTVVGYAGAHGVPNALEYLIQAAKLLDNEAFEFILIGKGLEKDRLRNMLEEQGIRNVKFFDPVPKTNMSVLLKLFDIAYIGLQNKPIFRFGISPNKLADYMMTERVVLYACNASNDWVSESGCGIRVAPENSQAIADGLRKLQQLPEAERVAMGKRGKEYILKKYTYEVLAGRFLQAMQPV